MNADRDLPPGLYITLVDGPTGISAEVRSAQSGGAVLWSCAPIAWTLESDIALAREVALGAARLWAWDYAAGTVPADRSATADPLEDAAATDGNQKQPDRVNAIAGEITARPAEVIPPLGRSAATAQLDAALDGMRKALAATDALAAQVAQVRALVGGLVNTRSSPESPAGEAGDRGDRAPGVALCPECAGRGVITPDRECARCGGWGGIPQW